MYVLCQKNEQLQLQVSIICHVNNIFRISGHTLLVLSLMCVLKIRLYDIIVCSCIITIFSQYN